MTTLIENPWPLILAGIFAEAVLGLILFRTGRGAIIWLMAAVLLLVAAGLGLERLVVTDLERVEAVLDGAAAALASNPTGDDLGRMLDEYIAPSAGTTRNLLSWALGRVEFTAIKITHLEISINRLTSPATAEADMTAYVGFRDRTGQIPYEGRSVSFTMKLQRETPDRWLITGHAWHDDPR